MGIKPANEVKMDIDWAERVLQDVTYFRILIIFQDQLSWILAPISDIPPSPMSAQLHLSCLTPFQKGPTPIHRWVCFGWSARYSASTWREGAAQDEYEIRWMILVLIIERTACPSI